MPKSAWDSSRGARFFGETGKLARGLARRAIMHFAATSVLALVSLCSAANPASTAAPTEEARSCGISSVFIEYPVEPGDPPTHRTSKTVHQTFDPAVGPPADCTARHAIGPLDCAPIPLTRAEALARGEPLGDDAAIIDRDGELWAYRFGRDGRTTEVTWDPSASGSFDYVFEYRGHCGE